MSKRYLDNIRPIAIIVWININYLKGIPLIKVLIKELPQWINNKNLFKTHPVLGVPKSKYTRHKSNIYVYNLSNIVGKTVQ